MNKKDLKTSLMKFEGTLQLFWETGMENSMGITVHDNRGNHEGPSFNNETQKWDGPPITLHSHDWTIWLGKYGLYKAKIYNKNNEVDYDGSLTYSQEAQLKLKEEKNYYMFVPEEIEQSKWIKMINEESRIELYTNCFPNAIMKEYDIKYTIGCVVYDNLTKKHVRIKNIFIDKDDKVGYYISSKHQNGLRNTIQIDKAKHSWKDFLEYKKSMEELDEEQ